MVKKYLDTYALAEIAQGNPQFLTYLSQDFIISDLTLAEFYAVLLWEEGVAMADHWFKKLEPYSAPVVRSILIKAIRFRYEVRKQNVSFFDAVGYIFALEHHCLFVTGDKEFEGLRGVEFRK